MMPIFFLRPGGQPGARWDDPDDPRFVLAHFIGAEIHLMLANADEFLQAVEAVQRGEAAVWRWNGNSFTVESSKGRFVITDHYWEPGDPSLGAVELTPGEFRTVVAAWRDFVLDLQRRRQGSPGVD